MGQLPAMSGRDVVRVFGRLGWYIARQRGSHIVMIKQGHLSTLSVPDHREVAKGTLRSLIRAAGISVEEFVNASR